MNPSGLPPAQERSIARLRPSPLAIVWKHLLWVAAIVWGLKCPQWLGAVSRLLSSLPLGKDVEPFLDFALWSLSVLVPGFVLMFVLSEFRWLLGAFGLVLAGAVLDYIVPGTSRLHHATLVCAGICGLGLTELGRWLTLYEITDQRLVIRTNFGCSVRVLEYSAIDEIHVLRGLLGRLLDYGDVVPLTAVGIDTGATESRVGMGAAAGSRWASLLPTLGVGRSRMIPRASDRSLRGVRDPEGVMELLFRLKQRRTVV